MYCDLLRKNVLISISVVTFKCVATVCQIFLQFWSTFVLVKIVLFKYITEEFLRLGNTTIRDVKSSGAWSLCKIILQDQRPCIQISKDLIKKWCRCGGVVRKFTKTLQLNYDANCVVNFDEFSWKGQINSPTKRIWRHYALIPSSWKLAPGFLINKVLQVGLELIIMYV